jgi:hypothetical protein
MTKAYADRQQGTLGAAIHATYNKQGQRSEATLRSEKTKRRNYEQAEKQVEAKTGNNQ